MKVRSSVVSLLLLTAVTYSTAAFAHGGRLDKNGCHTDHKTGSYHCHGAPASSSPAAVMPRSFAATIGSQPNVANVIPVTDSQLLLAIHRLLTSLGYVAETPDGAVTADLQFAAQLFRAENGFDGADNHINGELLLQLTRAIADRCKR